MDSQLHQYSDILSFSVCVYHLSSVQIPNQHRRHSGSLSASLPVGRRQFGPEAGLRLLRALLQWASAVGALCTRAGRPRGPAGEDPVGSWARRASQFWLWLYNSQETFVAFVTFFLLFFLKAKKIALAGQQFARNHLMGDKIFCYYFKLFQVSWRLMAGVDSGRFQQVWSRLCLILLNCNFSPQEYAKLQVTKPKIRTGMELVEQPADDLFPCTCHRKRVRNTDKLVLKGFYFFIEVLQLYLEISGQMVLLNRKLWFIKYNCQAWMMCWTSHLVTAICSFKTRRSFWF